MRYAIVPRRICPAYGDAAKGETCYIALDGSGTIDAIREDLLSKLK